MAVLVGSLSAGQALSPAQAIASPSATDQLDPVFPAGTHRIEQDLTLERTLIVAPGARLAIAEGATLTLRGDMIAPADTIFFGPGRVDLNASRLLYARPEWWGAKADDASVDNAGAFDACIAAHPVMQLGPGDYHLPGGWAVERSNRRVWGIGRTKDARGTRLLKHGPRGSVLRVGPLSPPRSINDYVRGIDIRWIELGRTEVPSASNGEEKGAPVGLMVRHILDARFEGLRVNEHAIGYSIRGAVRSFFEDCSAFRSTGGSGSPADLFIGFDLDGRTPPIATGANASLYLIDCNVNVGGAPRLGQSTGCRLLGAFSDTFVVRLETTNLDVGIDVDGLAGRLTSAQRRNAHIDFVIDMPVLDQCHRAGLRMTGLSDEALVTVNNPYVGLSAGAAGAIEVSNSGGSTAIASGQLVGTFAPNASGIHLTNVSGFSCAGTAVQGFSHPIVATSAMAFDLVLMINSGAGSMAGDAIALTDCRAGYIRPRIAGAGYRTVVAADARTSRVAVNVAAIEQPRGGGNLVTREGVALAVPNGSSSLVIG